ncbi:MAG: hypothetical protein MZV64_44320 [Ignavibacteriales bacterium]|nr:hypothetical protein [Ignavibacteriales bacterium]
MFRALRLSPVVGRALTPRGRGSRTRRAWCSSGTRLLAEHASARDPGVVGRTLRGERDPHWTIVGVLPADVRGLGVDPACHHAPARADKRHASSSATSELSRPWRGSRTGVTLEQAERGHRRA